MTQNLLEVILLVFGPQSHSASFLQSWATHMYNKKLIYFSLLDRILYFMLKSCSPLTVHFKFTGSLVATMITECQSTIKCSLCKNNKICCSITILFSNSQNKLVIKYWNLLIRMDWIRGDEQNGGKFKQRPPRDGTKETISDPDKLAHPRWRGFLQDIYSNQRKFPKTKDGKTICMKLFLRGFCDKSCYTSYHQMTKKLLTSL